MNTLRRFLAFCFLTLLLLTLTAGSAFAGKDTSDGLMAAYKNGTGNSADLATVSTEASNFVTRAATDRAYAAQLLEAIQKNNPAAVVALIKQVAPKSTVQVVKLTPDFFLLTSFTVLKHQVTVCVSTETNVKCDGGVFSLHVS